jgi:FAD/FMN-containing dehydrogenase
MYKGPNDLTILPPLPPPDINKTLVYVSVSHSVGEFNQFLRDHQLFVPHGQCADVRLGGHAQTGGYGQLGRSFGLLGDHIWGIRMINHNGEIQEVTKSI